MELIIIDSNFQDIGPTYAEYDMEVGLYESTANDFQLVTSDPVIIGAFGCYIEGTEYGGLFEEIDQESDSNVTVIAGETWRGLLKKGVVLPSSGLVRAVSGDANTILAGLLSGFLGGLFEVSAEPSGVTVTDYEMTAYNPILRELDLLLDEYDAKLIIRTVKENGVVKVKAEIAPAQHIEGEYNEDNDIPLKFTDNRRGFNHCICIGGEEGSIITHLYADASGRISTTQTFTGLEERTMSYINTSLRTAGALRKEAKEHFREELNYKTLEVDDAQAEDMGDIGDIITGTRGDLVVQSPIERKIIAYKDGRQTITCNVKGG